MDLTLKPINAVVAALQPELYSNLGLSVYGPSAFLISENVLPVKVIAGRPTDISNIPGR